MKTGFRVVRLRNGKYIAKRKGLFGEKTLVEIYDGNWMWHFRWSYFLKPDGIGLYDIADTEEKLLENLSWYYHGRRQYREA